MINLTNKFTAIGQLQEANIQLYPTHIKIKLSLDINNITLTLYQTISKRFNGQQYDNIMSMLPNLHCKIDGWIYAKGEQYYKLKQDKPSRLLVSGNLSAYADRVFFNMCYMQFSDMSDMLSIELEGQWINKKEFINVVSDSPRLFNINIPQKTKENQIYKLLLSYNPECKIYDSIVFSLDVQDKFTIQSIEERDKKIKEDMMERLMLEYEIMSSVYGDKE